MSLAPEKKLHVLIIEASVVWQSVLENSLKKEAHLHIVGVASDTRDAMQLAKTAPIDILLIDSNLPDMPLAETILTIENLLKAGPASHPLRIIVLTENGANAPKIGDDANGVIASLQKSAGHQPAELTEYIKQNISPVLRKLAVERHYITAIDEPLGKGGTPHVTELVGLRAASPRRIRIIVIGVSTGGPTALGKLLPILCEKTDLPILIVQHMPRSFSSSLMDNLKPVCGFEVKEGRDNMPIESRTIYIAPGDQHMITRRTPQGLPYIALSSTPPEGGGFRPSVDVLFKAVAGVYANEAIAIVLTGMGDDGSKGVAFLKERGSYIIVQDEKSSVVWGMPKAVINTGNYDVILSLDEIPHAIGNYLRHYKQSA